jgi:predicted RNA-binding protein with TRAM domain
MGDGSRGEKEDRSDDASVRVQPDEASVELGNKRLRARLEIEDIGEKGNGDIKGATVYQRIVKRR